ncbi:MAG: hypothetical protein AAGF28_03445 [Pseudomonadota bacterium]
MPRLKTFISTAIASFLIIAGAQAQTQQASMGGMDDILMQQVLERAMDNGITMQLIVRCQPESVGVMQFDKIAKTYLSADNKSHSSFTMAWKSTCHLS